MLDESCIGSATSDIQPSGEPPQQSSLWKSANVLKKLPIEFQVESEIQEDAREFLELGIISLMAWSR